MNMFSVRVRGNSTAIINGKIITGNNIIVSGDGNVIADGVVVESVVGNVIVQIQGDVEQVQTASGDIEVKGSVNQIKTASGDVAAGGDVGSIRTASGDVTCKTAATVTTVSGDVRGIKSYDDARGAGNW